MPGPYQDNPYRYYDPERDKPGPLFDRLSPGMRQRLKARMRRRKKQEMRKADQEEV